MPDNAPSLDELRREIDRLDDNIQDLLIQRTAAVERIGALKGDDTIYLRPGRQAEILRRLVARHHGRYPRVALIRLWNEMMGALVALQGPFTLAVYMPERGAGYLELARDQYGAYTPAPPSGRWARWYARWLTVLPRSASCPCPTAKASSPGG